MTKGGTSRTIEIGLPPQGFSIPRLFFGLLKQRFTGTLRLPDPDGRPEEATVWFRGGLPLYTDWRHDHELLGELLVSWRSIEREHLDAALMQMSGSGERLGRTLIAMGKLAPETLGDRLSRQCTRKLLHFFKLRNGTASVTVTEHPIGVSDELKVPVNTLQLIQTGVSRHYNLAQIRRELPSVASSSLLATPSFARYREQFAFAPTDKPVLDALQQSERIDTLSERHEDPQRPYQLVYILWACQMLRSGPGAEQAQTKAPPAAPPRASSPTSATPTSSSPKPVEAPVAKAPVAKAPVAKVGGEETAFSKQLDELESVVDAEKDAFALFGLKTDAGRKEIRARWADLSKTFHPDALESNGQAEHRPRVERVFSALSEAYGILSNKESRAELAKALEAGVAHSQQGGSTSAPNPAVIARQALEADVIVRDADKLSKKGLYDRALEKYESALALCPEEPDIQAAIAWCRFQASGKVLTVANETMTTLLQLTDAHPKCTRAHYLKGMMHLHREEERLAKTAFEVTLSLQARHQDAEQQLHALKLRLRRDKAEKDKGSKGLRGLFDRKR